MHYINVPGKFNTDYDAYFLLKKQNSPEVPLISDKYKQKKIIKRVPLFEDALLRTSGSKVTLVYIVQENAEVTNVGDYPLTVNANYGASWSILE